LEESVFAESGSGSTCMSTHRTSTAFTYLSHQPRRWSSTRKRGNWSISRPAETHGQGIRYIETNDADGTVSHLVGGNVLITHPLH
jgi:hypothetical protein